MSSSWASGSDSRWRAFRAQILARDAYRCKVRGPGCTGAAPLVGGHVDHILPLAQGGEKYDQANARAACRTCNLKRGNPRVPDDPAPRPVSSW